MNQYWRVFNKLEHSINFGVHCIRCCLGNKGVLQLKYVWLLNHHQSWCIIFPTHVFFFCLQLSRLLQIFCDFWTSSVSAESLPACLTVFTSWIHSQGFRPFVIIPYVGGQDSIQKAGMQTQHTADWQTPASSAAHPRWNTPGTIFVPLKTSSQIFLVRLCS